MMYEIIRDIIDHTRKNLKVEKIDDMTVRLSVDPPFSPLPELRRKSWWRRIWRRNK